MEEIKDETGEVIAKVASPEEAFWIDVKKAREIDLKNVKDQVKYFEAILEMCEEKIKAEAEKEKV